MRDSAIPDGPGTSRPSAAAPGFRAGAALTVRVELGRLFQRWSIRWCLIAMGALPLLLAVAIHAGSDAGTFSAHVLANLAGHGAANFTVFALIAGSQLGLVLVTAYLAAESFCRDGSWHFLRVLMVVPVPRSQLINRKLVATAIVAILSLIIFTVSSILIGWAVFGGGAFVPLAGQEIPVGDLWWRLLVALGYLATYLLWIAAFGVMCSVFARDNSVIAFAVTLLVVLGSHLLGALPLLGELRTVLPTRRYDAWVALTRPDIDWVSMQWGVLLSLCYGAVAIAVAHVWFNNTDV